ncbi:(Dimethylallyl)adenosine tRNA methylthiotransferase MiaB [Prosthecochloris sp. CIB 2401]|nr:(Dimethylallyl)adenosine tRNA methylthiotransferase MiaB [Prosthecochloris sp. CIB 2401]
MCDKGMKKKVCIRTFGCQMNMADSEIMTAILEKEGYVPCDSEAEADLVLLNTCAVRDNAVQKILNQLDQLKGMKRARPGLMVGVTGCVPQYCREELFAMSDIIDVIAGPDSYRNLCALVSKASRGERVSDLEFRSTESYADIEPVRKEGISAFIPVMRGCNNMCAYCVVPFTRGRERSRPMSSVLFEAERLAEKGFGEITLLGQNVNSYHDVDAKAGFPVLLDAVAKRVPGVRIRFTTSHPKDMSPRLIEAIGANTNICNTVHLPVQSGSSSMLARMKRGHSREEYLEKVGMIRKALPGVTLSTDLISGFPGESVREHEETLSLLRDVRYDYAYTFCYSVRPGTSAAEQLEDDVPESEKKRRLQEIVNLQNGISRELFQADIGKVVEVLAESESRRSSSQLMGRTEGNRVVVFDRVNYLPGDIVRVRIEEATSATLVGSPEV